MYIVVLRVVLISEGEIGEAWSAVAAVDQRIDSVEDMEIDANDSLEEDHEVAIGKSPPHVLDMILTVCVCICVYLCLYVNICVPLGSCCDPK